MSRRPSDEIVYLDYAATTPLAPEVAAAMTTCIQEFGYLGNPSSVHLAGRRARSAIETAREQVAALINASPAELIFTSGATEADNLAIKGAARFRAHRGRHVVTVQTEHKAVLASALSLRDEGFDVTVLPTEASGRVDPGAFAAALRPDTVLASVMHVNNETGVIQDIEALGQVCRDRGVLFHTDAAQSAGKLPLDVQALPVDLVSLSGHKCYGPQGIGALYVAERSGCGVKPLLNGGSQEQRRRAGTEPVALIQGFGVAAEVAADRLHDDMAHVTDLATRLWDGLRTTPGLQRNGAAEKSYPGILNVSVDDVEGESLMLALRPLCVASGSACNAQLSEPSFVLKAMGLTDLAAQGAIRFSFGRMTTREDIDFAVARYSAAVARLRGVSAPAEAAA